MIKLSKILYPTDFSKHSLAALPYAVDLARQFDAQLHCLHVVDESYQYWMAGGESAMPVVIPQGELNESAQKQLDAFIEKNLTQVKDRLTPIIIAGRPFIEIIRYAVSHKIDLIVIATHGYGAIASMLLGSVTEKVVRKSSCPVLTVRHPEHKFEMP